MWFTRDVNLKDKNAFISIRNSFIMPLSWTTTSKFFFFVVPIWFCIAMWFHERLRSMLFSFFGSTWLWTRRSTYLSHWNETFLLSLQVFKSMTIPILWLMWLLSLKATLLLKYASVYDFILASLFTFGLSFS